ncbi:MAG: methionyl-tRNA formyltransferase [Bdellovibrionales bacterium]|jgi:methionyl-tRNA formyltransferase|nr:methionyl-tRNA formyltransferase [Bdellovibrionales bacterium]MBT3526033.1 methionyl-tRNA formyltransferase [Bdellovibrionales bacterium]MBT7669016.1 methionyl-tRNA formyltransferase [Bdellovibrionales bacterium]MBT7765829.1 methionyl-tRNA formyltransferase [Bdellovibrionales bacterium]
MKPLNTIFCGTPDFALPSLELLANHPAINLKMIITMPDRRSGRGKQLVPPPVATFAKENKLPLLQTENLNHEQQLISDLQQDPCDLIIVLAFAQFLGSKLLDLPKVGCFNIHTSLLPKYRGAAPIQYAILNNDKITGVSIQKMVKKMDAGDIACTDQLAIAANETGGQLYTRLKFQAALTLNRFLDEQLYGQVNYIAQDENDATYAPSISKEQGRLHFASSRCQDVLNQIRAFTPRPGTFCFLNGERLKVFAAAKTAEKVKEGELDTSFNSLLVGTCDGALRLTSVQLAGKKRCSDQELLNGFSNRSSNNKLEIS